MPDGAKSVKAFMAAMAQHPDGWGPSFSDINKRLDNVPSMPDIAAEIEKLPFTMTKCRPSLNSWGESLMTTVKEGPHAGVYPVTKQEIIMWSLLQRLAKAQKGAR